MSLIPNPAAGRRQVTLLSMSRYLRHTSRYSTAKVSFGLSPSRASLSASLPSLLPFPSWCNPSISTSSRCSSVVASSNRQFALHPNAVSHSNQLYTLPEITSRQQSLSFPITRFFTTSNDGAAASPTVPIPHLPLLQYHQVIALLFKFRL